MTSIRIFLVISTVAIFAATIAAVLGHGVLWPLTFFTDLLALDWRSQFNTDLIIHLVLTGAWIAWREGFGAKGCFYGFLAPFLGGMFTFPYVLIISYRAHGNMSEILLGVNCDKAAESH